MLQEPFLLSYNIWTAKKGLCMFLTYVKVTFRYVLKHTLNFLTVIIFILSVRTSYFIYWTGWFIVLNNFFFNSFFLYSMFLILFNHDQTLSYVSVFK